MNARSAAAAAFCAALAFGVGYATRLACAWMAGSTRVVEEAPAAPRFATEPSVASAPAADDGAIGRATDEGTRSTSAAAPDASLDAHDESPASDVPSDAEAETFGKALFAVHAEFDRISDFRAAADDVAVAPLGRTPEDLGLLDAGATAPAPLVEKQRTLRTRLSAVNVAASASPTKTFQFAALRRGGRFEVFVGDAGLGVRPSPRASAMQFAGAAARTDDQTAALLACCDEEHRDHEAARRALWTRLRDLAASGEATPLDPREVVGVCVADGRCVVVREGDDPELERLVDEADRLERAVRAQVESELRR